MNKPYCNQKIETIDIPAYIPQMSPQQIVWLEAYKSTMLRTYYTNSDACGAAAKAVKEFNKLFTEGATP